MQEPDQEQEAQEVPATSSGTRLQAARALAGRVWQEGSGQLRRLGLEVFLMVLPAALLAYPVYLVAQKLWVYQSAQVVQATLERIEIRTLENDQDRSSWFEARKHIDAVFYFKDAAGQSLAVHSDYSWPAPGLKRKLESQYQSGEDFSLYLLPDRSIVIDVDVAVSRFLRLTLLMGMVLVAMLSSALVWKRLLHQMPDCLPAFPRAFANSVLTAQAVALAVAALFSWVNTLSPMLIPDGWYLGAYWGLVALLTLCLRLLVFTPPAVAPPVPEEQADTARTGRPGGARE